MKNRTTLSHEFVKFIPEELEERTLYISREHRTTVHSCFCGCGREVVTPLSPTGWTLTLDGESVSLFPSIGNWNLPCQSHYFIRKNRVVWALKWTKQQIEEGRAAEAKARDAYFAPKGATVANATSEHRNEPKKNFWQKIKLWFAPRP